MAMAVLCSLKPRSRSYLTPSPTKATRHIHHIRTIRPTPHIQPIRPTHNLRTIPDITTVRTTIGTTTIVTDTDITTTVGLGATITVTHPTPDTQDSFNNAETLPTISSFLYPPSKTDLRISIPCFDQRIQTRRLASGSLTNPYAGMELNWQVPTIRSEPNSSHIPIEH